MVPLPIVGVPQQFALNDLDDDGNMDVVVAYSTPPQLVWMRNTGGLVFVPIVIVPMAALSVAVGCVTPPGQSGCHDIFFSASAAFAILHCRMAGAFPPANYTFRCNAVVENYADVQSLELADINLDGGSLVGAVFNLLFVHN